MPPTIHRVPLTAITCLALAGAWSPLQAQAGDIERVRIVLGSPVVYEPLPFDEPFYLTGRTGSRIDSVGVWIADRRGAAPDCTRTPGDAFESSWRRGAVGSPDSFYVRMDALDPNRSFDMCVRTRARPADERLGLLREGWATAIDSAFRRHARRSGAYPRPWEPDLAELLAFRVDLSDRLGPGLEFGAPSPIDPAETHVTATDAIAALSEAQFQADLAVADARAAASDVAVALEDLQTHPATDRLLAVRIPDDSRTRAFVSLHRDGLAVIATSRARRSDWRGRIGVGEAGLSDVSGLTTRLEDLWDPAAIRLRIETVRKSVDAFAGVTEMLGTLSVSPGVAASIGISPGEVDELSDLTERVGSGLSAAEGHLRTVAARLEDRSRRIDELAAGLTRLERTFAAVETHTHYDVQTTARNHIAADFGAVYLWQLGEVTPVLGANFYLRPVNRDRGPSGDVRRRLSFNVGVTTTSLRHEGQRADLFGSMNVVLGIGVRIGRILRVSAGGVVLRRVAPHEPGDRTSLFVTPHAALSLDFVVKDLISNLFGAVF